MKNGRKRLQRCKADLHELTAENRLWKRYTRKDGSVALLSNGCRPCNAAYSPEKGLAAKLRRCP